MVKCCYYGVELDLDFIKEKLPRIDYLNEIDCLFPATHQHGFFRSSTMGGCILHYRNCLPPSCIPLRGILVWQHGIGSSSAHACKIPSTGELTNFALLTSELYQSGYGVYLMDMKGHGLSEGIRFYIPGSWTSNRDDFLEFIKYVVKNHPPSTPLFVGGDSYGGNLAIHVVRMFQDKKCEVPEGFRGMCLVAPAIIGELPPAPVVFLLRYILKPLYPTWSPFFMPNPVSPERVWSDPEVRALQTNSKKIALGLQSCATPFRLGTAANLLAALEHVREHCCPGLRVPFFVAHGAKDVAVPFQGTEDFLISKSKVTKADFMYIREEDARHDLLAEPCREAIVKAMRLWMDSRLEKPYNK